MTKIMPVTMRITAILVAMLCNAIAGGFMCNFLMRQPLIMLPEIPPTAKTSPMYNVACHAGYPNWTDKTGNFTNKRELEINKANTYKSRAGQ